MGISISKIRCYLKLSLFQTILFTTIYGITNYFSTRHFYQFKFYTSYELEIPLMPGMIIAYFSLNLLMILPVYLLDENEMGKLNKSMTFATIVAGIIFLLFPAPCGFERFEVVGFFAPFFKNLYKVDYNGNTLPSLHITYSFMLVSIYILKYEKFKLFFKVWFLLIAVSVVLTHQHHIADILAGIILGHYSVKYFYEA
jgi:membrane-associated phospholipid phosphatase